MEQPAVSQQLRVLRELGFVRAEKQGRKKIYELNDPHVARLLEQAIAHAEHLRQRDPASVPFRATNQAVQP